MSSSPLYRPDPFAQPFFRTASAEPQRTARPVRGRPAWLIVVLLAVLFGGIAYLNGPTAIGLYYASSGQAAYAAREEEKAIAQFDKAVRWQPENLRIRELRCRVLSRVGQFEKAKEDLAFVTAQFAAAPKENLSSAHYLLLAQMHQECGEYRKAFEAMRKATESLANAPSSPEKALELNNLAYFAALAIAYEPADADEDAKLLDEMLANAEQALRLSPGISSFLDTRGYLHYLKENYSAAIADFDKALAETEELMAAGRKQIKENPRQAYQLQIQLREIEYSAAVMYQHRMKAHQKAGNNEFAEKDRKQIEELGFNPEAPLN